MTKRIKMSSMLNYSMIKERLLRNGQLFEDQDFPASARSIRKDGNVPHLNRIVWKRPKEISDNPKFIENEPYRQDIHQGELGDCWFLAGAACLSVTSKKLFERAVPPNQSFDDGDYAGIFRFNFWHFGTWLEVVVDDRIPTIDGNPVYGNGKQLVTDEYWVPLLEKAYAKLYESYHDIEGGLVNDALVDFTGGISENLLFLKTNPNIESLEPVLFQRMSKTTQMSSMMGCGASDIGAEGKANGLFGGHAYSITKIAKIDVDGKKVRLVRLRNPWGKTEWTGAWGDTSPEWRSVTDKQKKELGLVPIDNGEFWMEYGQWIRIFEFLMICHLSPDALTEEVAGDMNKHCWKVSSHQCEWVRGLNAGGSGLIDDDKGLFWTNPQFSVVMDKTDDVDADGKCTIVVSLMQEHEDRHDDLLILFCLYKLKSGEPVLLDGKLDNKSLLERTEPSGYRETTSYYKVEPGTYVIIPSTTYPNRPGKFLLRIYTESNSTSCLIDRPSVIDTKPMPEPREVKIFNKYCGADHRLDANELRKALSDLYQNYVEVGFDMAMARTMVARWNNEKKGSLNYDEYKRAINDIEACKTAMAELHSFANDHFVEHIQNIAETFKVLGITLSRQVMTEIIHRYGGRRNRPSFEDFVNCCNKLILANEIYQRKTGADAKTIELSLEEWLSTALMF